MERIVEAVFNRDILEGFLKSFQLESTVEKLGDFENYVFKVYGKGNPLALRITHSTHRCIEEIEAELDWVNYLHVNHVHCPKAFTSLNGKLIETIDADDGTQFFACLFSYVDGHPVKINSKEFDKHLFYVWGQATGRMHAVTKEYKPLAPLKMRPSWHEDELLDIKNYVEDKSVIASTNSLIEEIRLLPQYLENYGLIHTDIHSGNFFYDGETIHVFDFDDCSYHWFASDIAIPLYYSIYYGYQNKNQKEREAFAKHFLEHFLKGYETENPIPNHLMEQLPLFLKLRDITLYSVLHKKIALEDRDERLNQELKKMKQRIVQSEPIVQV